MWPWLEQACRRASLQRENARAREGEGLTRGLWPAHLERHCSLPAPRAPCNATSPARASNLATDPCAGQARWLACALFRWTR